MSIHFTCLIQVSVQSILNLLYKFYLFSLEVLMAMALSTDEATQEHAVEALGELITIPSIQVVYSLSVCVSVCVSVLMAMALSTDEATQEHAVEALGELITIPSIQVV